MAHTFRLRIDTKIVGYLRLEGQTNFYSKDGFWWNGGKIDFELQDRYAEMKDKNDRKLYEHDIVALNFKNPVRKGRLARLGFVGEQLYFIYLDKAERDDLAILSKVKSLSFVSFAFLNTDLLFSKSL